MSSLYAFVILCTFMMVGGNQESLQEGGNEARNLSDSLLLAGPTRVSKG